ncbi:hypothetical protein CH373_18300 [Leptospira perolatii]|uniref:HEAT repeat domain-containing protein n=2 Tax=Leptospira perolatii TaxID=2023191 RepID=A0A2M9ZHY7_9LEPT|nr:hypothetical protein CH360_18340 [Leptospira perolatii]PJZ71670.1 hypothetical protein CH373_18300 [Leptospira perolatii]
MSSSKYIVANRNYLDLTPILLVIGLFFGTSILSLYSQDTPSGGPTAQEGDSQNPENTQPNPQNQNQEPTQENENELRKYDLQFRDGLLGVFRSEAYRNITKLGYYALNHPIPRVRAAAALALGRLKSRKGVYYLHKMIDRDGETARQAAYQGLADIGSPASLDYFYEGTKSEDRDIRVACFKGMGKTLDPGAREVLLQKGLTSSDKEIVLASIAALGYYQVPEDIRLFVDNLNSEDEQLQKAAVQALGVHKTRTAMSILEDAFTNKENLRTQILDTLAEQRNSYAIFALIRILESFSNSEAVVKEISIRLYRLKAYGKFLTITRQNTPLLRMPYVGAEVIRELEMGEVGKILGKSHKRFIIEVDGRKIEDFYYHVMVATKFKDSFTDVVKGWVFGPFIKVRNIKPPKKTKKRKRPPILDSVPEAAPSNDQNSQPNEPAPSEQTP